MPNKINDKWFRVPGKKGINPATNTNFSPDTVDLIDEILYDLRHNRPVQNNYSAIRLISKRAKEASLRARAAKLREEIDRLPDELAIL